MQGECSGASWRRASHWAGCGAQPACMQAARRPHLFGGGARKSNREVNHQWIGRGSVGRNGVQGARGGAHTCGVLGITPQQWALKRRGAGQGSRTRRG